MECESLVIGLGGLVVAALTIYLSYKARTSPYREMLYSRQLEGYADVVGALTEFYIAGLNFIVRQGHRLGDDTRPKLRLATLGVSLAFHSKHQKWAIFLPKDMNEALGRFVQLFNAVSAHPQAAHQYPSEIVYANDPGGLLAEAYAKVVAAARKGLGTEPLSEETLRIIGQVPDDHVTMGGA
jgi:hypothetical protein